MKRPVLTVVFVLGLSLLLGCAASMPELSPMQKRQLTTRLIEATYDNVFKSTMTVLQDNEYIIKNTDMNSGLIVASINKETSGGSQFMQAFFLGRVDDKNTRIEVSATVNKLNESSQELRIMIQETNEGQSGLNSVKQILEPELYQKLFNDITLEVKRKEAMNPNVMPKSLVKKTQDTISFEKEVSIAPGIEAVKTVPMQEYSRPGTGHWVKKILNSGAIIILEDGSMWEVSSQHETIVSKWANATPITVTKVSQQSYQLTDITQKQTILAKYSGMKE